MNIVLKFVDHHLEANIKHNRGQKKEYKNPNHFLFTNYNKTEKLKKIYKEFLIKSRHLNRGAHAASFYYKKPNSKNSERF
jgi:hypothetical protein